MLNDRRNSDCSRFEAADFAVIAVILIAVVFAFVH